MNARKAPLDEEQTRNVRLDKLWSELMDLRRKVQEAEASQQNWTESAPRSEGK